MNRNFLVFPSTKMLPMEDIAKELKIIHGFQSSSQNAKDTDLVGGVLADQIAIAATDENGDMYTYQDRNGDTYITERESVKNALYLNGVPANEYLTSEQGMQIQNFGKNVAKTYSDEIAALRDELYQLRGELARNGFVNEYGLYAGFQDFFRESDKKYLHVKVNNNGVMEDSVELCKVSTSTITAVNINKVIPTQPGIIKEGDWFVITDLTANVTYLVKAIKVELVNSEEEITFESSISAAGIPSIDTTNSVICKVHGDYYNGTFSFSKVEKYALTNKERFTMLNDDSNAIMQKVGTDKTGFAATFKVPQLNEGALNGFTVMTRTGGTPGALTCYCIEESKMANITDLDLEKVGENEGILAKSKPISYLESSSTNLTETKFEFADPITGKLPVVKGDRRYCFVVVTEKASSIDYWEIQFSNNMSNALDPDVQTNNFSYNYVKGSGFTLNNAIGDLIFVLSTIEVKANSESPRTIGMYTSKKIEVHNNSSLARARLTMRINREGMFTSDSQGIINDGGVIKVTTSGINPDNLGIKQGDTVIIGNNIRKALIDCNFKNITLDKAISATKGDPVYRMGYDVYLRAVKTEWIGGGNSRFETVSDICLPMNLIAVMPDVNKLSDSHSDRLIFECEFRDAQGLPVDANEFYLQVVWHSNASQSDIISNLQYTGRIYDLNLSFDRTL